MISLKELYTKLQHHNLVEKRIFDMEESEVVQLCEDVLSSIGSEVPPEGWEAPHLDMDRGELVIPHTCHPDYHWWKSDGPSIIYLLEMLGAPEEIRIKYAKKEVRKQE